MDYKPSRKINNRSGRNNVTGFFPSIKNKRTVAFESSIERDFIHLLEFDENVISYFEQPIKIEYINKNRKSHYTPDFLVNRINKTQIVETKLYQEYLEIMKNEEEKFKYIIGEKYCQSEGYEFKIITELNIRSGYLLDNITNLFTYSRRHVPTPTRIFIREILNSQGTSSINNLISILCDKKLDSIENYYSYILSLLYSHDIYTDLTIQLSGDSVVSLEMEV